MSPERRWSIIWVRPSDTLRVVEPTMAEVAAYAPLLSTYYNEPHNRTMLAHSQTMSVEDVIGHYRALRGEQGRPLVLLRDERLIGDADLRGIGGGHGELAIMVGDRALQGQGLGTAFGIMAHALAFRMLGLTRTYVSILPQNTASRRLFERLGYTIDVSPAARAIADEGSDLTMALDRATFEQRFEREQAALQFAPLA